jgi:hypothetical protein
MLNLDMHPWVQVVLAAGVGLGLANSIAKRTFLYPHGTWRRRIHAYVVSTPNKFHKPESIGKLPKLRVGAVLVLGGAKRIEARETGESTTQGEQAARTCCVLQRR